MKFSKEEKYARDLIIIYNLALIYYGKEMAIAKMPEQIEKLDKKYKVDGVKWIIENPERVELIKNAVGIAFGLEIENERKKGKRNT